MNYLELKNKNKLKVIGLMSGTSLDGLDICYAEISKNLESVKSTVIHFESISYSKDFKKYIETLAFADTSEICVANFRIANEWTKMVHSFIAKYNIDEIHLIGSHGQTVWHEHGQSTLQIGEASVLSYNFSVPCIADFRVMDVAAGGSGAPLVPFIDYLWFKDFQKNFLLLNIGGIANFTIIPKNCKDVSEISALDTGPGNGLIDAAVSIFTDGEMKFDTDGKISGKGEVDNDMLRDLMTFSYFSKVLPKSTGKEMFGKSFVEELIKKYEIKTDLDFVNFISTLTQFTAETIYLGYQKFYADKYKIDEIIVSGGGIYNPVMMKHLQKLFNDAKFVSAENYNIDPEAKEALAFAILAALRIWEIPSNVPSVTGAKNQVLLGKIIY